MYSETECSALKSSQMGQTETSNARPNENLIYILFQDLKQATEALNRLQGFVLLSSDRGGIRIEYAKNKMGEVVSGL